MTGGTAMKPFRIAHARFFHESHSFSTQKTGLEKFKERELYYKDDILTYYQNTKTETGAFIDFLHQHKNNVSAYPIITAAANPSGKVTAEAYRHVKKNI